MKRLWLILLSFWLLSCSGKNANFHEVSNVLVYDDFALFYLKEGKMTEQKISYEEIADSNMMSIEALVSLLTRKGLITEQEILDELKAIKIRDEKEKN